MKEENIPKGGCCVINIDDIDARGNPVHGGTHWVATYGDTYFDSFGSPPIDEAHKLGIKRYNTTQYQHPEEVCCGHWAIYFIKEMAAGKSFEEFLANSINLPRHKLDLNNY